MKSTVIFLILLLQTLLLANCSEATIMFENKTGADLTVNLDNFSETLSNTAGVGYTMDFQIGEKSKDAKVSVEGNAISLTTNITLLPDTTVTLNLTANRGGIKIMNASGKSITTVNISSTSGSWGSNYLSSPILNGESAVFGSLPAGSIYSIRIIDTAITATASGVTVTNGPAVPKTWNGASII